MAVAEPVGFAVVGLGRWARSHAAAAARVPSVRLVSCYSRSEESRRGFVAETDTLRAADSYASLLEDPEVEAVVLATPNDVHVDMALQAIEAGKAVLVDKPVGVDVADALRLLRAPGATPSRVSVAHHMRRLGGVREAARWIASGEGGSIRLAHAGIANEHGKHIAPDAWRKHGKGSEGGVLVQVGIHQVDNLLHLLGPVAAVSARLAFHDVGPGAADTVAVVMEHTGGTLATLITGWTVGPQCRFDLLGTRSSLFFDLDHAHWSATDVDRRTTLTQRDAGGLASRPVPVGDPLAEQLEEVATAVRQGTPMEIGALEGLRAVAVVEAAVRSGRRGGAPVAVAELLAASGATSDEVARVMGAGPAARADKEQAG